MNEETSNIEKSLKQLNMDYELSDAYKEFGELPEPIQNSFSRHEMEPAVKYKMCKLLIGNKKENNAEAVKIKN